MTITRRFVALCFALLLASPVSVHAQQDEFAVDLSEKAILLTRIACEIYPEIKDLGACTEKVVRSILSDSGVNAKEQDSIIESYRAGRMEQGGYRSAAERLDILFPKEHSEMVLEMIDRSCAVAPAIDNTERCMDKAYHSILASRDPHSGYMNIEEFAEMSRNTEGDLQGIGAEIVLTDAKEVGVFHVMPGSPAERAGVKDGDRIVVIVNGEERSLSSSFANANEAVQKIRGKPNSQVTLEILRGENDERIEITVTRAAIKVSMVNGRILASPNDPNVKYGYVKLVQFGTNIRAKMVAVVKELMKEEPGLKGFIFDVRGNPGGLLTQVYETVDAVADSPDALVSIRDNSGIRPYGKKRGDGRPISQPGDITNGLPIAVMIDGRSASASEIFAGALKELDRAVIIGKGTWRKGTVQYYGEGPFSDGSGIRVTQSEYLILSPTKWVAVQCVGVDPDISYESKDPFTNARKEKHECDLPGAIVSGGARSEGNPPKAPLATRNPALYEDGLEMLEAVKVIDQEALANLESVRSKLRLKAPQPKEEEKKNKE